MGNPLGQLVLILILLSLAVASASMAISQSVAFAPMRRAAKRHSPPLGELLSCPYCLSHWLSFLGVLWFRPIAGVGGFLLCSFAVVTFSVFGMYIIADFLERIDHDE